MMLSCYQPFIRRPKLKRMFDSDHRRDKERLCSPMTPGEGSQLSASRTSPAYPDSSNSCDRSSENSKTSSFSSFPSTRFSNASTLPISQNLSDDFKNSLPLSTTSSEDVTRPPPLSSRLSDEYCSSVRLAYMRCPPRRQLFGVDSASSPTTPKNSCEASRTNLNEIAGGKAFDGDDHINSLAPPEEYSLDDFEEEEREEDGDSDEGWARSSRVLEEGFHATRLPNILSTIDSNVMHDYLRDNDRTVTVKSSSVRSKGPQCSDIYSCDVKNVRATNVAFDVSSRGLLSKCAESSGEKSAVSDETPCFNSSKFSSDEFVSSITNGSSTRNVILKSSKRAKDVRSIADKHSIANLPLYCYQGCCCLSSLPKLSPRVHLPQVSDHPPHDFSMTRSGNAGPSQSPVAFSPTTGGKSSNAHKTHFSVAQNRNASFGLYPTNGGVSNQTSSKETNFEIESSSKSTSDECFLVKSKRQINLPFPLPNDENFIKGKRLLRKKKRSGRSVATNASSSRASKAANVSSKHTTSSESSFNNGPSIRNRSANSPVLCNSPLPLHRECAESYLSSKNSGVVASVSLSCTSSPSVTTTAKTQNASLFSNLCSCTTLAHHYKALPHAPLILQNSPSSLHAHTFRSLSHPLPNLHSYGDPSNGLSKADTSNKLLRTTTAAVLSSSAFPAAAPNPHETELISSRPDEPFEGYSSGEGHSEVRGRDTPSAHHTLASDILRDLHKSLPREIVTSISSFSYPGQVESVMFLCADRKCLSSHADPNSVNSSNLVISAGNCMLKDVSEGGGGGEDCDDSEGGGVSPLRTFSPNSTGGLEGSRLGPCTSPGLYNKANMGRVSPGHDLGYHTLITRQSPTPQWPEIRADPRIEIRPDPRLDLRSGELKNSPYPALDFSALSSCPRSSPRPQLPSVPPSATLECTEQLLSPSYKGKKLPRSSPFDRLADDLLVKVFSFLPTTSLCAVSRVCRRWYALAWEPSLWTAICLAGDSVHADRALKQITRLLSRDTSVNCVQIEKVSLNGCSKLSDRGLSLVGRRCPELRHLEVKGCVNVTNVGIFELVTQCVNLVHLDVTGCHQITCIHLSHQGCTDAVDSLLHSRQLYLQYLDMTDCYGLHDPGLKVIVRNCPQLLHLYLRRCINITDVGIKHIASYCQTLREASISDCVQVTDFGMYELAKLGPNLRYLSVAKCDQISDAGIKQIARHCYKLRYLNVRGCEAVSDDSMEMVARSCPRLRALDIGKCDVTDNGMKLISENCPNLKKLSVKSCDMVTDRGIQYIAYYCRGLQQLNIQDCQVTLDGYRTVKKLCRRCIIEHTNPGFF